MKMTTAQKKNQLKARINSPKQVMSEFRLRNAILFIRKIFFFNSKAMNKTIIDKGICSEDKQKGFLNTYWQNLEFNNRMQDSSNVYFQ